MIPLFKHTDKVYDLPVIAGVGDIPNPDFSVCIIDTKAFYDTPGEGQFGELDPEVGYLGDCESMDEALSLVFSHLDWHPGLSRYLNNYYRLEYLGCLKPGVYTILVDFGDPVYSGRIELS